MVILAPKSAHLVGDFYRWALRVIDRGADAKKDDLKPQSGPRNIWLAVVDRLPPNQEFLT